ncbi:MAG TPA: hypothetical protein VMC08_10230 [Bacteroidales bacterium]|nr:hypothetical protein [Bacteroidales bacterium]
MLSGFCPHAFSQKPDSSNLNYNVIFGYALNANAKEILKILDTAKVVSQMDKKFKLKFENRFKYESDRTNYFVKPDTTLNPLNRIFQDYWRKSMLDNHTSYDKYFEKNLITFLKAENQKTKFTNRKISASTIMKDVYPAYILSKGFHGTKLGKTGNLYDLLVWKNETDTTYIIVLINDTARVPVVMMKDFISLGWEEYATLGAAFPGGWTTPDKLFCVRPSYDISSETFRVNYLSHEGQHFLDYKHFPKLSSNDLEYRAKLIELYLYDQELYNYISFFISNANYDKSNAHPYADFCVIRDMSRELFHTDFEKDMEKWQGKSKEEIHQAAKDLFLKNTESLNKLGKNVKEFVK